MKIGKVGISKVFTFDSAIIYMTIKESAEIFMVILINWKLH